MKLKNLLIGLFLFISVNAFSQANVYYENFYVVDSTYKYIPLDGTYQDVYIAVRDTIGGTTVACDVNYGTDSTWYTAYYFITYGTTATAWTTKTFPEASLLQFCDKAIRKLRFYLIGANATWTLELKARR